MSSSRFVIALGIGLAASTLAIAPSDAFAAPPQKVAQKKKPAKKAAPPPPVQEAEPPPPAPPPPPPAPVVASEPDVKKDAPPAAPPTDADSAPKPISVAPLLGYATSNLNLGVGLRAGYTLEQRIYIGGTFVYHLGKSEEISTLGGKMEASAHAMYPGVEAGYDLPVGPVVIRPYGGVGIAFVTVSQEANGQSKSDTKSSFAFWPGCAVSYAIPKSPAFVGADARLLVMTEADDPSFGMFATGGVRF